MWSFHPDLRFRPARVESTHSASSKLLYFDSFHLAPLYEINGGGDSGGHWLQTRPVVCREDDNRDFAMREILLIADVLVARDQHVESGPLRLIQQRTVVQALPLQFAGTDYLVSPKRSSQGRGGVGVEEDSHAAVAGCSRDALAKAST